MLEVPLATLDIVIGAFSQGLRDSDFFSPKKPPHDYDELLAWAERYINMEKAQRPDKSSEGLDLLKSGRKRPTPGYKFLVSHVPPVLHVPPTLHTSPASPYNLLSIDVNHTLLPYE